ncbi:hypothetical protein [Nocardia sp. NPDC058705]|uniref:hypothetical protein n=1 Tax=Nocardia sp. NPDC058705 TaxID=3346609 RepID=UPI00369CEC0A
MRTWTLELTYRSGQLDGDIIRAPRGTQIREMGIELLGEHTTEHGNHDNELKPRALRLELPGPGHPGLLEVTWLSDHFPPLRVPPPSGRLNWGQGTSVVDFHQRQAPTAVTVAALEHYFTDNTDTENWSACRLRTRSGVLFKRDHTDYVSANHLLNAIANRWELVTTWTPPGTAKLALAQPVPANVMKELLSTCAIEVRRCGPSNPHQIATKLELHTPAIRETPLEFDLDLRCASTTDTTLTWFRTLCAFAEIASIGRYTPTGLGSVTSTPISRA